MIDFITNIPGKYFLLYFVFYVFLLIIMVKIYRAIRDLYFGNKKQPNTYDVNYIEMAFLKQGVKGAVSTVVFNLWNKKIINISKKNKTITVNKKTTKKDNDEPIENLIYSYAHSVTYLSRLYTDSNIKEKINRALKSNITNLQKLNLLYSNQRNSENKIVFYISLLAVYVVSFIKLFMGISRDKPVLFLILLMIAAGFAMYYFLKPKQITPLGKDFLNLSNIQFEHFKQSQHNSTIMEDNSIIYAIALFGVSPFLMDSSLQETFSGTELYNNSASSDSSGAGGGDGGSGCSGCSSGCGGGGCGGCG